MIKRFYLFSFLLLVISIGLVSAASPPVEALKSLGSDLFDLIKPFVEFVLGSTSNEDIFFARLMLFILLLSFVYLAVSRFPGIKTHTSMVWVVTFAVSILGVRFVSDEAWIQTILLPYSALGIAITTFLPFAIYFFFVEDSFGNHHTLRKMAWVLAAVIFIGLWATRQNDVNDYYWMYLVAALLSVAVLFLDGTIQNAWHKVRLENSLSSHKRELYYELVERKKKIIKQFTEGTITDEAEYKRMIKEIDDRILSLGSS